MSENIKGNLTTILMVLWVIVCPYISDYLTQEQFVAFGLAVVGVVIWFVNAYWPNSFSWLGNAVKSDDGVVVEDESDLINEEYFE